MRLSHWAPRSSSAVAVCALLLVGSTTALAQNWATFVNQTSQRLIGDPNVTTNDPEEKSFAFGDLDQDGDIDLVEARKTPFTNSGGKRNVLWVNEGTAEGHGINGVLVDRTATLAPDMLDLTNDRDIIVVDVTGDGWLDVVTSVTLSAGQPKRISHPRVYVNQRNDLNGNWLGLDFDDEDRMPTLPAAPAHASVCAGDVDGDGDIDLYFSDYSRSVFSNPMYDGAEIQTDKLFINDGTGYFADESTLRMTNEMLESAFGTSSAMADMNGDNKLDIVKDTALFAPQQVSVSYNDPGDQGYFDRFDIVNAASPYFVNVADLNNDNKLDYFVADDGTDHYHLNSGNDAQGMATFTDKVFTGDDGFGGNAYAEDLNNDGFRDVVITDVDIDISGCGRRTHIYRNLGNLPNVTLSEQGSLGIGNANLTGTHDVAIFDINGDGWKDMVLGRCNATYVWVNQPPAGLIFTYPDGLPGMVPNDAPFTFRMQVAAIGGGTPLPGTGKIYISTDGGPFVASSMTYLGNNTYETTLPGMPCADSLRFYVSADEQASGTHFDPDNAPTSSYRVVAATDVVITRDELEGDTSAWSVLSDPGLTFGAWEVAIPNGTVVPGGLAAPDSDATAGEGVKAFVTANGPPGAAANAWDVDGGWTRLLSPMIDLEGTDAEISYARWFFCDDQGLTGEDRLLVDISNNGGANWTLVHTTNGTAQAWQTVSFLVSDYVTPTAQVRVRFSTGDIGNNSITEAGIDNFEVRAYECADATPCPGDVDGDGTVGQSDLGLLLSAFGHCLGDPEYVPGADFDGDDCIGQPDLGVLLGAFGQDCP